MARLHVAVGHRLRVRRCFERVLHDGPLPDEHGEPFAPFIEGGRREHRVQDVDRLGTIGHERPVVRESGIGHQVQPTHGLAQMGPVLRRLEAGEGQYPAILCLVVTR